jgi:hypothetical protein
MKNMIFFISLPLNANVANSSQVFKTSRSENNIIFASSLGVKEVFNNIIRNN